MQQQQQQYRVSRSALGGALHDVASRAYAVGDVFEMPVRGVRSAFLVVDLDDESITIERTMRRPVAMPTGANRAQRRTATKVLRRKLKHSN